MIMEIHPAKGLKDKELFYTKSPPSNLGNEANYLLKYQGQVCMVCMNTSKAMNLVFDDWQLIEISLLLKKQIDMIITLPPDFD